MPFRVLVPIGVFMPFRVLLQEDFAMIGLIHFPAARQHERLGLPGRIATNHGRVISE